MRKETDLEAVKKVARSFVYLDVHINEKVGFICNHPYIGQIATVVNENGTLKLKDVRNEKDLEEIDALARENLEFIPCRKISQVLETALCSVDGEDGYRHFSGEKLPEISGKVSIGLGASSN